MKEPWYVQLMFHFKIQRPKSELGSIKTNMDYDPSKDYNFR